MADDHGRPSAHVPKTDLELLSSGTSPINCDFTINWKVKIKKNFILILVLLFTTVHRIKMPQIPQVFFESPKDNWDPIPVPPDAQPLVGADDEGHDEGNHELDDVEPVADDEEPAADDEGHDEGNHEPDPVVEGPSELDLVAEEQAQASFEEQAILRGYDGKFQKRQ